MKKVLADVDLKGVVQLSKEHNVLIDTTLSNGTACISIDDESATGDSSDVVIRGVAAPQDDTDAANKKYVDTQVAGVVVPTAYTSNPAMDGMASPGSSTSYSKGDHVHPTDTSRAADNAVVHKTNSETITGYKTFTGGTLFSSIELNPGLRLNFLGSSTTGSVRNEINMGNGVTENNVGVVEFADADDGNGVILRGLHAPTSNGDAANKKYVDDIVGDIECLLAAI